MRVDPEYVAQWFRINPQATISANMVCFTDCKDMGRLMAWLGRTHKLRYLNRSDVVWAIRKILFEGQLRLVTPRDNDRFVVPAK